MVIDDETACPCGHLLAYSQCCMPFHKQLDFPKTAEALMRSRYSAYVFKNESYLLATWYKTTRPVALNFANEDIVWQRLEILQIKKGQRGDEKGRVNFKAYYIQNGQSQVLNENSRFKKVKGYWFYVDGALSD
jgi:SEC-C motif-containing protein